MVIIISGATHTGKTNYAQKLLEKYKYPYLSIDHLKMGLIRSGNTNLTPLSNDDELTAYLWPIVREIVKTAIENKQNLIVEGCYVPHNAIDDFDDFYSKNIKFIKLIMSEKYIKTHYNDILSNASVIEKRLDDSDCTIELLIRDNKKELESCTKHGIDYHLIDDEYNIKMDI